MNRTKELLRFVSKDALGVEIAPYFNPLTPKSEGYNCRIVDVFGEQELRAKAKDDPNIPNERIDEIEVVDFVGDASNLGDLLRGSAEFGACDYIVSSHNFEHLPNPIRFLRGCEQVLRPGGVLSMAIPDYRACFDHFRFPTRLADWIEAYHEERRQPSPASVLDARLGTAIYRKKDGTERPGFRLGSAKFGSFSFGHDVSAIYEQYLNSPVDYVDTHCSVTCPEIFHLLISDLIQMGLVRFEIMSISRTRTFEYFVHLRKPDRAAQVDQAGYNTHRPHLLNEARLAMGHPYTASFLNRVVRKLPGRAMVRSLAGRLGYGLYLVDHR